jgi:putative CocE/NonD family hydrolase
VSDWLITRCGINYDRASGPQRRQASSESPNICGGEKQGPNEWRYERDWPLPDEHRLKLYLRALPSGTNSGLNDGALTAQPPSNDATAAYEHSPGGPYNQVSVNALTRPLIDKSSYESHALTWTSAPLESATEMTGYPRIDFWASSSVGDTDFVVEITDVGPTNGTGRLRSQQVTRGYLNATRFFSRTEPRPLAAGKPYHFQLELYPTSYVFAAGHRIRVVLQGGALDPTIKPSLDLALSVPGIDPAVLVASQGPGLNQQRAKVTLFQDSEHPSFLELPIVGSGWRSIQSRA